MKVPQPPHLKRTRIREQILFHLRSQNLGPGNAIPSERDLVRQLGVSRVTIRAALATLVSERILARRGRGGTVVVRIPEDLHSRDAVLGQKRLQFVYFPSEEGKTLAEVGSFTQAWQGFERLVSSRGDLALSQAGDNFAKHLAHQAGQCDGILAAGTFFSPDRISLLKSCGLPFVLLNWHRAPAEINTVSCDFFEAGLQALEILSLPDGADILALVVQFSGEPGLQPPFQETLDGLRRGAATHGFKLRTLTFEVKPGDWQAAAATRLNQELRAHSRTAGLIACSGQLNEVLRDLQNFEAVPLVPTVLIDTGWVRQPGPIVHTLNLDLINCGLVGARRLYELIAEPQPPQRILLPLPRRVVSR